MIIDWTDIYSYLTINILQALSHGVSDFGIVDNPYGDVANVTATGFNPYVEQTATGSVVANPYQGSATALSTGGNPYA